MGKLSFENGKFWFDSDQAKQAGFKWDFWRSSWVTRSYDKAVKLRQWADACAELRLKKHFITHYPLPESIPYPDHLDPHPYQLESAWHCLGVSPAYCADEAGLGKTITSVLCMNAVPGKTLVICPPFLKYNWAKEIEHWSISPEKSIGLCGAGNTPECVFDQSVIILPDSLISNERIKGILSKLKFTWLIIDEAHRFKSTNAKRTQSLLGDSTNGKSYSITDSSERIVCLSGTPIPNGRPIELYPLLAGIVPSSMAYRSYQTFGEDFCAGKLVTRHERGKGYTNWDFNGASNLTKFRKGLRSEFMIRHLKKDVMEELGPKTRSIIFLDAPKDIHQYEKKVLKNHTLDELIGDGHKLGDIATYRRELGEVKTLPATQFIHEILEETNEKLVVFAYHINVVEDLCRMLQPYGALMIRGGMNANEKHIRITHFQNNKKHRVIVGNIDAMGVGHTLTAASRTITVEPSWSPGVNEQAEDRIHRISQKENTYHQYLILRDSLDERILSLVLSKQKSISKVMD